MSDLLWAFLFAIGVAQGLFLGFVLLMSPTSNQLVARSLGILVLVFTLSIVEELIDVLGFYPALPHTLRMSIWMEFAMGPLVLGFANGLRNRSLSKHWWLHFAPLILCLIIWLPFYLKPGAEKVLALGQPISSVLAIFVLTKAGYLLTYLVLALKALPNVNTRGWLGLNWVRPWLIAVIVVTTLLYVNFLLNYLGLVGIPDSDYVGSLILALFMFVLAYGVIRQPKLVFSRTTGSKLDPDQQKAIGNNLEDYLKTEKPYLDPDLTLRSLAQQMAISESQLTEVLNSHLGNNFYGVINGLRLDAVTKSFGKTENDGRTILELAFSAGFNSKAAFYRAFRGHFGVTPNQYRSDPKNKNTQDQGSHLS